MMLQDEMSLLKSQLENERKKVKEMWHKNCDQLCEILAVQDGEIEHLKHSHEGVAHGQVFGPPSRDTLPLCRGKVPPVYVFTGENLEILLDDWLLALQRPGTSGLGKSILFTLRGI